MLTGLGGRAWQHAARREYLHHLAEDGIVEILAQTLEQCRAADPHHAPTLARQGGGLALQFLGEGQRLAGEGPPGAERPEHPEEQAIDVLGGDAAKDGRRAKGRAPEALQGGDLVGQLEQLLGDEFGFTAGARGAQGQQRRLQIEPGGLQGFGRGPAVEVVEPGIERRRQARAGGGLGIRRQDDLDPGAPGAEQGAGQVFGIVQVQGQAPETGVLEGGRQLQGALPERKVQRTRGREQFGQGGKGHGSLRTRWRTSHSPANSRPIRP